MEGSEDIINMSDNSHLDRQEMPMEHLGWYAPIVKKATPPVMPSEETINGPKLGPPGFGEEPEPVDLENVNLPYDINKELYDRREDENAMFPYPLYHAAPTEQRDIIASHGLFIHNPNIYYGPDGEVYQKGLNEGQPNGVYATISPDAKYSKNIVDVWEIPANTIPVKNIRNDSNNGPYNSKGVDMAVYITQDVPNVKLYKGIENLEYAQPYFDPKSPEWAYSMQRSQDFLIDKRVKEWDQNHPDATMQIVFDANSEMGQKLRMDVATGKINPTDPTPPELTEAIKQRQERLKELPLGIGL